jgi:sterol carrier protein 2
MTDVAVCGVGMTRFRKPSERATYVDLGREAATEALMDAGIGYDEVQQAFASYVLGDTCCGQRVLYQIGMTGIPIVNVNDACASGSTALFLARQAILSGQADCVLAVGFEQMNPGAMTLGFSDRPSPFALHDSRTKEWGGADADSSVVGWFAASAREIMRERGTEPGVFAQIAVKSRRHAANNPRAVFRDALSLEDVLNSPVAQPPLTRFQCSPPTSGAAAAIVCSDSFARRRGLRRTVRVIAQRLTTDPSSTLESGRLLNLTGAEMAARTAALAYGDAGLGPRDVQVVELHDCFTSNEFISYEALQLAAPGEAERLVRAGDNTYGGRFVVNPSGGLLAKGHPIGATGLAQCAELVWQLEGRAGARQVDGARVALQHNLGIGGACVVTLYGRVES